MAASTTVATMKGSVLGVILHDICEEIRLEELREILGAKRVEPSFKHATPEYVRFEKPPVVERLDPVVLSSGETLSPQIKYYDYGVVSVLFELGFEADWEALVQLAARWVPNAELERQAQQIIRGRLERIAPAIVRPYNDWLSEDYYIFLLSDVPGRPRGADLLAQHGPEIAQMLRGEQTASGAQRERGCSSGQPFVLPQRSGGGRVECRAGLRHAIRSRNLGADSGVRQLAVAGISPL